MLFKDFVTLIRSNAYENIAFHRVIENKLIQAGDLEFGKKGNLDYGKNWHWQIRFRYN